ncbi:MAG: efflux RND transporter periplasmic adaptor subunit [Spirochaetaceae bacterium]|nr:MAG: efflux RND transporter periplasmic adaptor subunit [Spirochaetaceae bacterium]
MSGAPTRKSPGATSPSRARGGAPTGQKIGKRRLRGLVVVLALAGVFIALPVMRYLAALRAEPPAVAATPVVIGPPRIDTIERRLRYTGNLHADSTVTAVARIPGTVDAVRVRAGETVAAGDVVARIDDATVRLQMQQAAAAYAGARAQYQIARTGAREEELESARASLEQAEEDFATARANFERTERLFEAGTVARSRFEEAENALRSARTQLENARRSFRMMEQGARPEEVEMARANADAARNQYELAQLQLGYARVTAPIAGTVARVLVQEGNSVSAGTPLIAIVTDGVINATVAVPERHYGAVLTAGAAIEARIVPIAYADREPFPGRVTSVDTVIDGESRTFEVEIAIENPQGLLRPGMFVNATLILERRDDTLMVPSSAIVFRDGRRVVFIVDDSESAHASSVPVEIGTQDSGWVEVLSGITADDAIVIEGNAFLEDGQRVQIAERR